MTDTSDGLGRLLKNVRHQRGLSRRQIAQELNVGVRAVQEIESGEQQLELSLLGRYADALMDPALPGKKQFTHMQIVGPTKLSGSIVVRSSKNAAVALMCASLLNEGRTVVKGIALIEEVNRILEVLVSIGVEAHWTEDRSELELRRPAQLDLSSLDVEAARRTRSVIMFLGPLLHLVDEFRLPYAGGCDLGERSVTPHLQALASFGLAIDSSDGWYSATVGEATAGVRRVTLTERGDTVTENVLMAASLYPGTTIIRNASPNYMVQDLCFFLQSLGVRIEGIGTTTLRVTGQERINRDITVVPSEDPIEAMSLLTAAIVTGSELTIERTPVEFLEVELAVLGEMGLDYSLTEEYAAENGFTRLVDITVRPSKLRATVAKIHPMPFPGLNIDNLPFFAVIAAVAEGETLIYDWVYENRAIHLLELNKLGATTKLLDPHRLTVKGPTHWRAAHEIVCPPALRPAVCLLLAALAADGTSVLRNIYVINRGYEDLPNRLNALGARIETFTA